MTTTPKSPLREDWYELSSLKVLSKALTELKREDEKLFRQILSFGFKIGIVRFAEYIRKEGKRGMIVARNAAQWIDNPKVKDFRSKDKLISNFQLNRESLGEAWYQRWQVLQDENEYLGIIREIIKSLNSYRMMWAAPSLLGTRPRFGYLYRKGQQKPILVVIDQDGFIEHAEVLKPIWQSILATMDSFFKIDAFSDTLFYPFC